jgi:hypothetical protein
MAPSSVEILTAPEKYTPVFCDAVRVGCTLKMESVEKQVANVDERTVKIEDRLYSLLIVAILQLVAIVGGIAGIWMVNHQSAVVAAETVVKNVVK